MRKTYLPNVHFVHHRCVRKAMGQQADDVVVVVVVVSVGNLEMCGWRLRVEDDAWHDQDG